MPSSPSPISGMWKPGKPRPSPATPSPATPPRASITKTKSASTGKKPKKLSGATMGMRFMQRKKEAAEAAEKKRQVEEAMTASRQDMEWKNSESTKDEGDGDTIMTTNTTTTATEEGQSVSAATTTNIATPQIATDADMYGIEADIVGRRSFGKFNKSVGETYESALALRRKNVARSANGKGLKSDEELLRRYKKYVRGDKDGPGIDKASVAPIGNLGGKAVIKDKNKTRQEDSDNKRKRRWSFD